MSEVTVTSVGDAWVNATTTPARRGTNYGDTNKVRLLAATMRGYLLPELPNLAGRIIVDAYLVGRSAGALVAQTVTLTPVTGRWSPGRVTWADQPAVATTGAVAVAVSAVAAADATVTFPGLASMVQAVADGTAWWGVRVTTSEATTVQEFRSTDSGVPAWELHVTVSDAPEVPTNLRPDGGVVATASPILAWELLDLGGEGTGQAQARIQVDTPTAPAGPDPVAPDYDSGWLANTDSQFALAGVFTPAGTVPHYWRVNVRDTSGVESGWSDWADYTATAMIGLTVGSPVGPFGDPSPTLLATATGGTVASWEAMVTGPDRADIRARTELQTGPIEWDIPLNNTDGRRVFREDEQGWIRLRAWPTTVRAVAVGESPYAEVWIQAVWDEDLGVAVPSNLTVTQKAPGDPRLIWRWYSAEAADAYLLQCNEVTVARVEPSDLTVDGGYYEYVDSGQVPPLRPHVLGVRAVDGDTRSAPVVVEFAHTVEGVWLLHATIPPMVFAGTPVSGFVATDRRARYEPLFGPPVDVIYDWTGRTGSFAGFVSTRTPDVWGTLDSVDALRMSRDRNVRMVWGSQSITARIVDPDATSSDDIQAGNLLHDVRFEFVQVGD